MLPQQTDLKKNLLEGKNTDTGTARAASRAGASTPREKEGFKPSMLAKLVTKNAVIKVERDKIDREVYVEPTTWNKIKLFVANVYEIFLLCLGLGLSIYQDDLISFVYQLFILWLLYLAGRNTGKHIFIQHKINLWVLGLCVISWITKYVYILQVEPTLTQTYSERELNLKTFGFNVQTLEDGTIKFLRYDSLEFETLAILLSVLLLIYYNGQIERDRTLGKFHYVHNSEWLSMHGILYRLFFIFIIADTLFSQTLIQMVVLDFNAHKFEYIMESAVLWIRRLYTLQIALLAFAQIIYVLNWYKSMGDLYHQLFIAGLILNEKPAYAAFTHIMIIGWILGLGQLFEVTFLNHKYYKEHIGDFMHHNLTEALINNDKKRKGVAVDEETGKVKNLFGYKDIVSYDYQKFMTTYKPYLCIWGSRFCAVILSYAYHGFPALISLTWVLLSFIVPLYPFVEVTIYTYLPLYVVGLFFQYYVNIPGIYYTRESLGEVKCIDCSIFINAGRIFRFPAVEIGLMVLFTYLLISLMKWKSELKVQRDEIKIAIFTKLSDHRSNFLFQLFFYALKRIHILFLTLIFIYGMREINIYYIGIMYFFVVYVSSLATYRRSGKILVLYAGFFIWIQYFWSLIQKNFDNQGDIYKIFTMITLQKYSPTADQGLANGLNKYMEYQIPVEQWIIFILQVMMVSVNNMFISDRTYRQKSLENPNVIKDYNSIAEYFEEKCDFVLRKKFPQTARFIIRLQMIFSEMMIIIILIVQGFILVNQSPNIMFWGFLIFSLTLQTAVVSASNESEKVLRKCKNQSYYLRLYSSFVLIAQICYHFIQDKSFLAQYGFDKYLEQLLGPLTPYMTIIGFENYAASTRSMFAIFVSQILFYITANILEDYFSEKLEALEIEQKQEEGYEQLGSHLNTEEGFPASPSEIHKFARSHKQSMYRKDGKPEDEEFLKQDEKEEVLYEFERVRFTIPYMIYQRINFWRFIDSICMNFYIVTATVTIILATNWQISLFMCFYLLCNVILCIRAASSLHSNSQKMKNFESKEINIDQAHQMNKDYMYNANESLLKVRTTQWTYQYWLLILSMIVMYPTPIMAQLNISEGIQEEMKNKWVFWLFWTGLYTSPKQVENFMSHAPLYLMLILLIFEKQAQRWINNRYGCTLQKISQFKTIDEKMRLIQKGESPQQKQEFSKIPPVEQRVVKEVNGKKQYSTFVTILEAKQECARIKSLYREQTPQVKEKRLKNIIQLALKRKYTIKLRSAMKIVMEQLSLQLLLFSCANKSNIISILYLALLLTFLLIKNKTTGMLIMSYVFGITLALEYLCTLTNFTSLSNPMEFPYPYNEGYPRLKEVQVTLPSSTQITVERELINEFVFPWFNQIDLFKNNLIWAHFFSIDIESAQVNDIWFDFANLIVLTIYFFNYGNPINALNIKVSFSSTVTIEDCLNRYAKMQMKKKYYIKKGKKEGDINFDDIDQQEDLKNYFPKKNDPPKQKLNEINQSFNSELAADDSQEHFLGATFYLTELKNELFIYYFVRKTKYFIFIGLQIITLVMTFILAITCRSLMSIGYLLFCVPIILSITDFFKLEQLKQQGKTWKHPYLITGPLMIYCFVDIALQIMCQTPFYQTGDYFLKQLGFDKVYDINRNVKLVDLIYPSKDEHGNVQQVDFVSLHDNGQSLIFLVLKSINLFHIFLQSRVYESTSFWEFIRIDLRRLINLANSYKRNAISFRYNNWKLQKIVTLQQRKRKMYESVAELRIKMNHWQKAQKSLVNGELKKQLKSAQQPLLKKITETDEEHKETPQQQIQEDRRKSYFPTGDNTLVDQQSPRQTDGGSSEGTTSTLVEKLLARAQQKKQMITEQLKMGQLKDFLESDENYLAKQKELKKQKAALGKCASWYLTCKKKYVNQITFIDDLEEAQRVKCDMEKGKRRIYCDLERAMIQDINLYYHLKSKKAVSSYNIRFKKHGKSNEDELQLKDMKKTQQFLKFSNLAPALIGATFEALFTNMATLAYISMIISMMLNAGIISIVFPFAIFGYALLEEARPGKNFWTFMTYYTLVIIFLKFIINLNVVNDQTEFMTSYIAINNWAMFGLTRVEGIGKLFAYVLPEILILSFIMGQIYYEHLIGLYDRREIDVEDIHQARERFLLSFQEQDRGKTLQIRKEKAKQKLLEVEEEEEARQLKLDQITDLNSFIKDIGTDLKSIKLHAHRPWTREDFKKDNPQEESYDTTGLKCKEVEDIKLFKAAEQEQELLTDINDNLNLEYLRRESMIDSRDVLIRKGKEAKKLRKSREDQGMIRGYFRKVPYFRRLFPKIKEQKPGVDFYAKITLVQFIICAYLIQNYTYMDARGTQNLENSNLFSFYMVIVLFLQILVMLFERYIARTNIMVNVKKAGGQKKQDVQDDENLMAAMGSTVSDTLKSITMHLQTQKTSETILFDKEQKTVSKQTQDILNIELQHTRMTPQQIAKFAIQWLLLILYHALVFWIFPLSSNDAIYGTPYCDEHSSQFGKYGCFSFTRNIYLIIFYIIFCIYFMLSAFQIRYGFPDFKEPSSLTTTIGIGPMIGYRIFYHSPFLMELKVVLDWCWSKTSLDIFQWLELAEIDSELFFFKNSNHGYFKRKLGTRIFKAEKWVCGCFCLGVMLFFLVGPFLMFSNLRYIASNNLVTDATIDFTIKISDQPQQETYEFPIFMTDSPLSMETMDEGEFISRGYHKTPETKFFEPSQVQIIKMKNASDTEWPVSGDYRKQFTDYLQLAVDQSPGLVISLDYTFSFTRPNPLEAPITYGNTTKILDVMDKDHHEILSSLSKAMKMDCSKDKSQTSDIKLVDYIPYVISLYSSFYSNQDWEKRNKLLIFH